MNEETKQFIQNELKQFRDDIAEIITAGFENVDKRFENVDERFESIDKRFENVDKRFVSMDKRFDGMDKRFVSMDKRFDGMDKRFVSMDKRFDVLEKDLDDFRIETGVSLIHIQRDVTDLRKHLEPLGEPYEVEDMLARLKYVEKKLKIESGK